MRFFHSGICEADTNTYTDLAVERRRADLSVSGVHYTSAESDGGLWECVEITTAEGAKSIGRPIGRYDTLNTGRMDLLCEAGIYDATEEVAKKLCEMVEKSDAVPERILVVGLGNRELTPDSVGARAAESVRPTMHIKAFDENTFYSLDCSEIAVIKPGVTADSGIETAEIVRGVCRKIMPDLVIAVDSVATASEERLGSSIQICDTGIHPGGGIGNLRSAITREALGIPVIAIGVPTVIDSRVFAIKKGADAPFGSEGMMVAPKEIDDIVRVAARVIGDGINQAFGICPF
ncbi:MAG: GPR endopeptidase [Clostridia bacterium]|nr:GPR endopeptidase [Clostridia bacterium]